MDDHTVTGRVVAVLDAVAERHDGMTLAELTRRTGIPKPTVRRIAADLVARRLLERRADHYVLGGRLLDLGVRAAAQRGLQLAGTPHIQDLHARTGEIAWVASFGEDAVTQVGMAFGANRARDVRRGGSQFSLRSPALPAVAAGRVLLAERPDLTDRLRVRPLVALTRYTTTSWPQLDRALEVVRDTGIAIEVEQGSLGFGCLAAALRGPDGDLVGAIGVTGRTSVFTPHRLVRQLLTAAADINRTLAGQDVTA